MNDRVSSMLCCDDSSVEDTSTRSRHVRGFCGILSRLRLLPVLDWSMFIFIFSTVSCAGEGLTWIHERTLAGRPGSKHIIPPHVIRQLCDGLTRRTQWTASRLAHNHGCR